MACDLRRVRELIVGFGDVGVLGADNTVGKLLRVHVHKRTNHPGFGGDLVLCVFPEEEQTWLSIWDAQAAFAS